MTEEIKNNEIEFDDFAKVEMKVGKVLEVVEVEGSDKLYRLKVSFGEENPRVVLSGIKKFFTPDDLLNNKFVFVTNLKKRKIMGEFSEAMILAAEDNGVLAAFSPNKDVKEGSALR
jgi:methionyl-tRNA synthetase